MYKRLINVSSFFNLSAIHLLYLLRQVQLLISSPAAQWATAVYLAATARTAKLNLLDGSRALVEPRRHWNPENLSERRGFRNPGHLVSSAD